jgi:hypothetical protein
MARLLAEEILEEEVVSLAGERYSRKQDGNSLRRWGSNSGSIRIDEEKVPIDVPRVRDTDAGEEQTLESYQAMKSADTSEELTRAVLLGLSPTVVGTGNREITGGSPASLSTGSA